MADKHEVRVGDRFIIEVGEVEWHPTKGNRYWIKGFNTLVFDDCGIRKLKKYEEPPKEVPHSCEFCKYEEAGEYEMPCAICDKNGVAPKDMFEAKNGK